MVARAALSALHHEGGVQKGSATETWWSTWSWIAMTSGVNGPCGSLMRGEKTHRRSEGLERPLGKPCCGMRQNGKTSRACRDLLACTAFNQPRGALACGGGAGDTFSRAGSGGGGVDVIKGTRRWTLVSRRPSQVSTSRHPLVKRDSRIRKRNMQAAYVIDFRDRTETAQAHGWVETVAGRESTSVHLDAISYKDGNELSPHLLEGDTPRTCAVVEVLQRMLPSPPSSGIEVGLNQLLASRKYCLRNP